MENINYSSNKYATAEISEFQNKGEPHKKWYGSVQLLRSETMEFQFVKEQLEFSDTNTKEMESPCLQHVIIQVKALLDSIAALYEFAAAIDLDICFNGIEDKGLFHSQGSIVQKNTK